MCISHSKIPCFCCISLILVFVNILENIILIHRKHQFFKTDSTPMIPSIAYRNIYSKIHLNIIFKNSLKYNSLKITLIILRK